MGLTERHKKDHCARKHLIEGVLVKYLTTDMCGRKFMPGAFKDCDGKYIPVLESFTQNEKEIIGYAALTEKEDGVYYTTNVNLPDECVANIQNEGYTFGMHANQLKINHGLVEQGNVVSMSLTSPCEGPGPILSIDGKPVSSL